MVHPSLVLLDNTVLANFAAVAELNLIRQLWPEEAATSADALQEYAAGVSLHALPAEAWTWLRVVPLDADDVRRGQTLPGKLGAGERSCLALAIRHGGVLATDDLAARAAARHHGVQVIGTVGILVRGVLASLLSLEQGNAVLARMLAANYRSPVDRLDSLI